MKKLKIVLIALALAIVPIFGVAGCGNKYHAVLYSKSNEWIDEDFLKENHVKGYYPNDEYIEGEVDGGDKYIYDNDSPASRTFIITDAEKLNAIFTKCTVDVNFDKEMVILYIFSDVYPRGYRLKTLKMDGQSLNIYYKLENKKGNDAVMLYQRCFMVVLDKLDIEAVEFIEQN